MWQMSKRKRLMAAAGALALMFLAMGLWLPLRFSMAEEQTLADEFYGVLTYRGSAYRDSPQLKPEVAKAEKLSVAWTFKTSAYSKGWGTGSGWTGQPLIVHWTKAQKALMKLPQSYIDNDRFTEVIFGSLDGSIYFVDLASGKESRPPIRMGNPIKGTLAIHGEGLPILYVGNGIPEKSPFGLRLYSLIDQKEIFFVTDHPKAWNAFDGSGLFIPEEDRLVTAGENGLFYDIKLNAKLDNGQMIIKPTVRTLRLLAGAESSVSRATIADKVYYFCSDNQGNFYKIDAQSLKIKWRFNLGDDADATPVIAEEMINGREVVVAYSGTEVDHQGKEGRARFYKLNLTDEKALWEKSFKAASAGEGLAKSDGGIIAPAVLGKGESEHMVFVGVNRWRSLEGGTVVALDRASGKTLWTKDLKTRFWSGMTTVVDQENRQHLVVTDRSGEVYLLEGKDGNINNQVSRRAYTEASLSGIGPYVLSTTRTGVLYCYIIQ